MMMATCQEKADLVVERILNETIKSRPSPGDVLAMFGEISQLKKLGHLQIRPSAQAVGQYFTH